MLPQWLSRKESTSNTAGAGDLSSIPGSEDPWRRDWKPTPVFLPEESHGQRSMTGCSPQGHTIGHD